MLGGGDGGATGTDVTAGRGVATAGMTPGALSTGSTRLVVVVTGGGATDAGVPTKSRCVSQPNNGCHCSMSSRTE